MLRSLLGRKSAPQAIDTSEKLAQALGAGYESNSGQRVTTNSAMQQLVVFNCVRVLAESMGMLPCQLLKKTDRVRLPATGHRLYPLITMAPNSYMTAQEFWELLVACLCLRGNFYAYKVSALGNVGELLPLNPDIVTPKLKDDWTVEYTVNFKSGTKVLTQDEIWHVRLFTLDGLNGLNPIAYARQALGLGQAMDAHAAKLFTNGAVTSGVLRTDQELSPEAFDRLKTEFQGEHMGVANAYKPMILEMGLDWKPISLSAQDTQFIESKKLTEAQICGLFRVPPHLVASMEKMTLNNIEHMGMSFVNYSPVPSGRLRDNSSFSRLLFSSSSSLNFSLRVSTWPDSLPFSSSRPSMRLSLVFLNSSNFLPRASATSSISFFSTAMRGSLNAGQ